MSLRAATANSGGDRVAILAELRDVLADSIDEADPDKRAPLAAQLRATLAELAALDVGGEVSASDDLAAKRDARRAAAQASAASR